MNFSGKHLMLHKKYFIRALLVLGLCIPVWVSAHGEELPKAILTVTPESPRGGDTVTVNLAIRDGNDDPVTNLSVRHERILHVLMVREDLTGFMHVHPEEVAPLTQETIASATFSLPPVILRAGLWHIIAQFAVSGEEITNRFTLEVEGQAAPVALIKDLARQKTFGDYRISLAQDEQPLRAGVSSVLTYSIEKNGVPAEDLMPYLGAAAHFALWSIDLQTFSHEHGIPAEETTASGAHEAHRSPAAIHDLPALFGPEVSFAYTFPYPGLYKIFGQFRHNDAVLTSDFMVEVMPPETTSAAMTPGDENLHAPVEIGRGFSLSDAAEGITRKETQELNEQAAAAEEQRSLIKIFIASFLVVALAVIFWPKPQQKPTAPQPTPQKPSDKVQS